MHITVTGYISIAPYDQTIESYVVSKSREALESYSVVSL